MEAGCLPSKHETLNKCCCNNGPPRRWPNITATFIQCLLFQECWSTIYDAGPTSQLHSFNVSCFRNVGPQSTTLAQHFINIYLMSYACWVMLGGYSCICNVLLIIQILQNTVYSPIHILSEGMRYSLPVFFVNP